MAIHYTHSPLVDPEPPKKPMNALAQLGQFPDEDKCKLGNMAELKKVLSNLPVRFNIEHFLIRDATIEISDLFVGATKGASKTSKNERAVRVNGVDMRFDNVTLYQLMDQLLNQLILQASLNFGALGSAATEVLSGVTVNMSNQFGRLLPSAIAAVGVLGRIVTRR